MELLSAESLITADVALLSEDSATISFDMTIEAKNVCSPAQTLDSFHARSEMTSRQRVVLSWSGGKDSAMAAYHLIASQKYEICLLLTTVTEEFDRISMHGVRRELLERQAESLVIPLYTVMIPKDCPNAIYEDRMGDALAHFGALGINKIAFGDLFLEDLRQPRRASRAGGNDRALSHLEARHR